MSFKFDWQSFLQAAGDAIVAATPEGKIVVWNPAAERIFGFTAEEALDRSLDIIIPERFRQRHWAAYEKVMASGQTRYGADMLRVPALHKDGRPLSIAFTVALLSSPDNKLETIAAIIRDETSRWNEEREMRRRLNELEERLKNNP